MEKIQERFSMIFSENRRDFDYFEKNSPRWCALIPREAETAACATRRARFISSGNEPTMGMGMGLKLIKYVEKAATCWVSTPVTKVAKRIMCPIRVPPQFTPTFSTSPSVV